MSKFVRPPHHFDRKTFLEWLRTMNGSLVQFDAYVKPPSDPEGLFTKSKDPLMGILVDTPDAPWQRGYSTNRYCNFPNAITAHSFVLFGSHIHVINYTIEDIKFAI